MTLKHLATKRTAVAVSIVLAIAVGAGAAVAAATSAFDPKAERDAFQAAVAKKLGVTTKQLEDAYKAAALERLDAAVADGRITKEQADAMRKRIESGDVFGPMGMGGPRLHMQDGMHLSAAAEYLGLDVTALVEKLRAGSSLADVAKAQGKSVDGLKKAMLAEAETRLDHAVEDGKITATQRDAMLERLEANLDDIVNGTGPMRGGDHDGGLHGGFGGGGPGWGMRGHGGGFGAGMDASPDA